MIKLVGVQPEVMATPELFREYFKDFGVERGRWIAMYPSDWKRRVRNLIRGLPPAVCGPAKKHEMQDKLTAPLFRDRFVTVRGAQWDEQRPWIENAEAQVETGIIDLLLSKQNPRDRAYVLLAGEFDPEIACYRVECSVRVPRKIARIFESVKPLITYARRIHVVDRYFLPDQPSKASYVHLLQLILQTCRMSETAPREITFHLRKAAGFNAHVQRTGYAQLLTPILEEGESIILKFWEESGTGETIHDRHLITDAGMIDSSYGWAEEKGGHPTTDLSLKSRTIFEQKFACFCGGEHARFGLDLSPDCTIDIRLPQSPSGA